MMIEYRFCFTSFYNSFQSNFIRLLFTLVADNFGRDNHLYIEAIPIPNILAASVIIPSFSTKFITLKLTWVIFFSS